MLKGEERTGTASCSYIRGKGNEISRCRSPWL